MSRPTRDIASPSTGSTDDIFVSRVLTVAAVGLLLRVLYILFVARRQPLIGDSETYHLLAETIADGRGYVRPRSLNEGVIIPTAEFPPVYPLLLAALTSIGFEQVTWHRLFGAALGTAAIVVVAFLARRVASDRAGVIAAVVAALYPLFIITDGTVGPESLAVLSVATLVLWSFRLTRITHFFAAGLVAGLAILVRSELMLVLVAIILPVAWKHWARRYAVGALLIGVAAVLGPWTIRNAASLGEPVVLTNNFGTLVSGANCDRVYSGDQIGLWRLDCVPDIFGNDEIVWAGEQRRVGLTYMRENVGSLPKVAAVRVARTFGVYDPMDQITYESLERFAFASPEASAGARRLRVGWAVYIGVAAFAVAGIVLQRRRRKPLWPLLIPLLGAALVAAAGYGNQRFRLPAEPMLVVLAAVAADALIGRLRPDASVRQEHTPAGSL